MAGVGEPVFRAVEADYGPLIAKLQDDGTFKQYSKCESMADAKVIAEALNRYYESLTDG